MSFPVHTQWMSHWPRTLDGHKKQAQQTAEDGAGGIIMFTGWHNSPFRGGFNIPGSHQERTRIFDVYRAAGLQVYSTSYLLDLGAGETAATVTMLDSYDFAGFVIDAEGEWEHLPLTQAQKADRVEKFCRIAHQHAPFVAYAPYWAPDYHHAYNYSAFNQHTDAVMPQIYWEGYHISNTAEGAYQTFRNHWSKGAAEWSHQPVLVVPIDDPHYGVKRGQTMGPEVAQFKRLIIQEFGHISHWYTPFVPAIRAAIKTNGVTPPIACPAGYHKDANGNCVPNVDPCPVGQHLSGGVCVPDTIDDPGPNDNPFIDPVTGTISPTTATTVGAGAVGGLVIGGIIVAAVAVVLIVAVKGAKHGEPVLPHLRREPA